MGRLFFRRILFYPLPSLIDSWTMALRERDPQVQYPLTRSAGSVLYALTALAFGNVIAALGDGIVAPSFLLFFHPDVFVRLVFGGNTLP